MPRPRKCRRVCGLPQNRRFGPIGLLSAEDNVINMTVDEYEAIRLIDLEGLTQEECANQMNVARTTVQGIYESARKKLAESLVRGKMLHIEGGEYEVCNDPDLSDCELGCRRRRRSRAQLQYGDCGEYRNQ